MPPYKKVNEMSETDAAYIAGLIDADGSILLPRRYRNKKRQLVLSISNTDFELLNHIKTLIGVGIITRKRTYKEGHRPSGDYKVENRQALAVLRQTVEHLSTYQAQRAELALRDYVKLTPRNGKYTPNIEKERNEFVAKFLAIKPSR